MVKTVLIVDDSAFIRQALRREFKWEADFEICGEAEKWERGNREGSGVATRINRA
jgi:YesN/AraC family two-component response regulator